MLALRVVFGLAEDVFVRSVHQAAKERVKSGISVYSKYRAANFRARGPVMPGSFWYSALVTSRQYFSCLQVKVHRLTA